MSQGAIRLAGDIARSRAALTAAVSAAIVTVAFAVWLPNLGLIWGIMFASAWPLGDRIAFVLGSLGALTSNQTVPAMLLIILLAVLVGLNLGAFVVLARRRIGSSPSRLGGIGLLAGLLGVGCSACGVGALSALFGAGVAAAVTAALPLGGLEFGLVGAAILLFAFLITARRAAAAIACVILPNDSVPEL